jgi:hypothetical protein
MKKLIVFLVLAMSFVPVFTAYANDNNAITSTLTRYVRDNGVILELTNDKAYLNILSSIGVLIAAIPTNSPATREVLNESLVAMGINGMSIEEYEWYRGKSQTIQQSSVTILTAEEKIFQSIRPVNEFSQFLNDNPATLPTNNVLNNIAKDFVRQMSTHPISFENIMLGKPTQLHRQQSNEFVQRMNENRHLDPASRAMHLNNDGMSSLLENIDGIFPYIRSDGNSFGFWNGREIWIATHTMHNEIAVPLSVDDMTYTVFYEIGRTLGFGEELSIAKADIFTGRAPIFDGPWYHRLGLHNVLANAYSNDQIRQYLNSQNLSAQDRQYLEDAIILDFNVPRVNADMPWLGVAPYSFHAEIAWENLSQQKTHTDIVSNTEIRLAIDNKNYIVNGVLMESDAAPFIAQGRTMIPLRIISEALGASVSFNSATGTVTIIHKGAQISLLIDTPLPNDMGTPVVINGRTFVPIRYVSETLGAAVRWDNTNSAVYIRLLL